MTVLEAHSAAQRRVGGWYQRTTGRWCYVFLLPALVLTAMFTFYPMVMSWVYSTMDWSGFNNDMTFVGLGNYRELLGDGMFWSALGRSMIFVLVGTPLRVGLALVVAVILNSQVMRLSVAFRTLFFLPVMASASIIGVVMTFVLSPNNGPATRCWSGPAWPTRRWDSCPIRRSRSGPRSSCTPGRTSASP